MTTLYLKTRPQTLNELDLEQVRLKLQNIVSSKNIPHAFLFSGPKGTGKTSAARILAKIINCEHPVKNEPCNACSQCLSITKGTSMDVIELDAASHRGIDDIRALRESISLSPSSAKKKIYIIDEAHMLTAEASNAFLKTLEEPPDHVIFILATTDPQKLPETVRSRLTHIQFTKASLAEIKRQLQRVAKSENLKIEDSALETIAAHSEGSFRDAVKILESLSLGYDKITKDIAESNLAFGDTSLNSEILSAILSKNEKQCLNKIEQIITQGESVSKHTDALIEKIRSQLVSETPLPGSDNFSKTDLVRLIYFLLKSKTQISSSPVTQLPLELAIIKWCRAGTNPIKKADPAPVSKNPEPENITPSKPLDPSQTLDQDSWNKILSAVRPVNLTIEALLRAAEPLGFNGEILQVGVYYRFHKEKLETAQNRRALEDIITQVLGSKVRVTYLLTERKNPPPKREIDSLTPPQDQDIIQKAKEIFGN